MNARSDVRPPLRLAFLDVGQADTIVVSCPSTREAVIVDCVDADAVLNYLSEERVEYVRAIIITHLHADHYCGVTNLIENLNSEHLPSLKGWDLLAFNDIPRPTKRRLDALLSDSDGHSSEYDGSSGRHSLLCGLLRVCRTYARNRANDIKVQHQSLQIPGEIGKSLTILHPFKVDLSDLEQKGLNNTSVILRFVGPGSSALLTSDIEPAGWEQMKNAWGKPTVKSDVLKLPHHGSWKDADFNDLLDDVLPSIVVASVGSRGVRYGHPHTHVMRALAGRSHIRTLCTEATEKCETRLLERIPSVRTTFRSKNARGASFFPRCDSGCPCAGTIIIELGTEPVVIHPEHAFHREAVIQAHFKSPLCSSID